MDFFPGDKVRLIVDDGLYIVTSTYDDGDCDIYSPDYGWGLTVKSGQLKLAMQDEVAG